MCIAVGYDMLRRRVVEMRCACDCVWRFVGERRLNRASPACCREELTVFLKQATCLLNVEDPQAVVF